MGFVSDVKSAYLNQTGFLLALNRSRIKAISFRGTSGSASQVDMFATDVAPVSATYGQSGATITVTSAGHGLTTGQSIGIAYDAGTGGTAVCGNPTITVVDANTFTITCYNSYTITGDPACRYVPEGEWLITITVGSGDKDHHYMNLPMDGLLATRKVHATLNNMQAFLVFYG